MVRADNPEPEHAAAVLCLVQVGSCHSLLAGLRFGEAERVAATVVEIHSCIFELPGVVLAVAVGVVVGGEEAASSGRAMAEASAGSARLVLAAVEGALGLDAMGQAMLQHSPSLELSGAILLGVEGQAAGLAVREHSVVAAAVSAPAVLWQRRLAGPPGSRRGWISGQSKLRMNHT